MQRIEIIALKKDGKKIINRLQRRGSVEICDVSDDALAKRSAASAISELEKKADRGAKRNWNFAKVFRKKAVAS